MIAAPLAPPVNPYLDKLSAELRHPAMRRLSADARSLWLVCAMEAGPRGAPMAVMHLDDIAALVGKPAAEMAPAFFELDRAQFIAWRMDGLLVVRPRG